MTGISGSLCIRQASPMGGYMVLFRVCALFEKNIFWTFPGERLIFFRTVNFTFLKPFHSQDLNTSSPDTTQKIRFENLLS